MWIEGVRAGQVSNRLCMPLVGQIGHAVDGRAPRWFKAARPSVVAAPMQLRPLAEATYLATLEPGRAPTLVTLEDQSP